MLEFIFKKHLFHLDFKYNFQFITKFLLTSKNSKYISICLEKEYLKHFSSLVTIINASVLSFRKFDKFYILCLHLDFSKYYELIKTSVILYQICDLATSYC